jgi:hypothetical protein
MGRKCMGKCSRASNLSVVNVNVGIEFELELIQFQMAQNPMLLWGEVGACGISFARQN